MNKKKNIKGFTLTELMLVVVILGIMASFAIPNYVKGVHKAYERDAIGALTAIHTSNTIYRANDVEYWKGPGATASAISAALNLNIISDALTYTYTDTGNPDTYQARATLVENATTVFTLLVDEGSIAADNPCCEAGTCLIATAC